MRPVHTASFPLTATLCAVAAVALAVASGGKPELFFGCGALLLAAGLLFARHLMRRLSHGGGLDSPAALALRNTTRRPGRSLATLGVLAGGVFMVVAVDSFRKGAPSDTTARDSGTGGFTLVGESASAIYEDLNTQKGREAYALNDAIMKGVRIVQMRVREGDDASCLNLNRAVQPRMIGGNFSELGARPGHFGVEWSVLKAERPAIPGVVDGNTLQWAMQKKVGDVVSVPGDRGESIAVKVVGKTPASILQGLVVVNESDFIAAFPNTAGYRFFLVDCPPSRAEEVRAHLGEQLSDRGLELVSAGQRLAEFNAVENTYLSIFQVLGGLGMLLGSAGLGVVVARNVLERRREFGLLEAVGWTPAQLRALVFAEHRWLIAGAVGLGAVSALVAVAPGIIARGSGFPWGQLAVLIVGMGALGAFWTWLATRLALRGSMLAALRSE